MARIIALAKKAGFLFGRTAVRPYKTMPSSGQQPFAPTKRCALRANSRSPLQEEYDSEYDHTSGRSVSGSSLCSWRESASITSLDAPPGITSRRSRPHLLPKPALRPLMFLSACVPARPLPAMRPMFYKASLLLLRYPRTKTRDPPLIFFFSLFLSPYLSLFLSLSSPSPLSPSLFFFSLCSSRSFVKVESLKARIPLASYCFFLLSKVINS
jgi:hypothetical protein